MWFLGGMTVVGVGWAGTQAVWMDFVSQYTSGWRWQLYANRQLIGVTDAPGERRIIGQLPPSDIPFPLTLIRVAEANALTDYGPELPRQPWNRYRLRWTAPGLDADTDHFDVIGAIGPGGAADASLVLARVPYVGNIAYGFELSSLTESGQWQFAIVPRDDAQPLGNAGTITTVDVDAVVMPPDVQMDDDGNRFSLSAVGGVATASFVY